MTFNYSIKYKSVNNYENIVSEAIWQFLVIPENNDNQELISINFNSSLTTKTENSINGYNSVMKFYNWVVQFFSTLVYSRNLRHRN